MKRNDDENGWDRRGFLQCMAWVGTNTFDTPGTYPYFGSTHSKMTGQVVVA